jgi:hypothetical protein
MERLTVKKMKIDDRTSLTIGDVTYRTSGNILFSETGENHGYVIAESRLLEKMDAAIQNGILDNGMQSLMRKFGA